MKLKMLLIILLLVLLLVQSGQAMESANYALNWYTLLNTGGGDRASSAHYAANFTIGQSFIGPSTSENYQAGLGYWYGLGEQTGAVYAIRLPLITK